MQLQCDQAEAKSNWVNEPSLNQTKTNRKLLRTYSTRDFPTCRRVVEERKLDAQTVPWALNRSSRDENYYGQTLIGSGAIWLFVREKAVVPVESAATEHLSPGEKTLYGLHSMERLVGKGLGEGCCAAEPGSPSGLFLVSSRALFGQLHAQCGCSEGPFCALPAGERSCRWHQNLQVAAPHCNQTATVMAAGPR